MMRRASWLLSALTLLTAVAPPLLADESANVGRLVAQPGSYDFAEREAAARALESVGPAALPELRQAAAGQDLEVRRRAVDLVRRLERRAEAARLLQAKPVRLVFQETPVPEALVEM